MKKTAPYGSWKSPITSNLIVKGTVGLTGLALDNGRIFWLEMRPSEGGRYVIVTRGENGKAVDITPPDFNVRTRAHEYGGGSFAVHNGVIYFCNFSDQRIWKQTSGKSPHPLTPQAPVCYADLTVDPQRNSLICVREDHSQSYRDAATNLVRIDCDAGGPGEIIVSGNDFYSSPRLSPDGRRLAWLSWNHPDMPWDRTELWTGTIAEDGSVGEKAAVHSPKTESFFQPEWSPDGRLYFVSDRTGWWNLYRLAENKVEVLCEMEAEFGKPQWVFGMSTYAFYSAGEIICIFTQKGIWKTALFDIVRKKLAVLELPYTQISNVKAGARGAFFIAGGPRKFSALIGLERGTKRCSVIRSASTIEIDEGYISVPEAIEFPTEGDVTAHAFFYAPKNRDYEAPAGELPPLIVKSHGGPTAANSTALSPEVQYWTSRGFTVVDVNYGGSTGYGRAYRERLHGEWGVVDVADCVNAARFLVEHKKADPERLAIKGGSAGGYTTFCALTFTDLFRAGASYYGISDLEILVKDTHKFESRYLDRLIGPYPYEIELYHKRSPIYAVDRISCPLLILQGAEDKIVPPNQSELIYRALLKKGIPVAYILFEGEQHGFRKAEHIKRSLEAELYFYSRIFGFSPADNLEPIPIDNL
ncbi:MAG: S9 family peptidase [Candidatus Omnitrophica bacterium]|nr:S9 family peptidase [Candidatus Omnitrophota bacterium]